MKVEIFSDVVCPWCAIGKRRFDVALEQFDHRDDVEVTWRSFELDPDSPPTSDEDSISRLVAKYGMTREEAIGRQDQMTEMAAAEGLEFHFDKAKRGNTFDAHRLLHYAHEVGVQDELKQRLFRAYFTDGEVIDDHVNLARYAQEVGLDAEKASEILASGRYADEVRAEEQDARNLGVNGVPFFVIDRQFGISGAQSPDVILRVLNDAWTKANPLVVTADSSAACEGDSCEI